jgi:hypothetical protein
MMQIQLPNQQEFKSRSQQIMALYWLRNSAHEQTVFSCLQILGLPMCLNPLILLLKGLLEVEQISSQEWEEMGLEKKMQEELN